MERLHLNKRGTSSTRIMILVVIINLMFSMAFEINKNSTEMDYDVFGNTMDSGDNLADKFLEQGNETIPQDLQSEGTFGNVFNMGKALINIFLGGLLPLPLRANMFSQDDITKIGAYGLMVLWALMYVLIAMEIYKFIKNKKAD